MRTILSVLAVFISITLSATHLLTGNFSFEYLSSTTNTSTYKVTLQLYRDLNGIALPNSATVYYKKLNQTSPSSLMMSQNSNNSYNLSSNCGSTYGVGVVSYEATLTLDKNSGYDFYYSTCCRPSSISNLASPSSQSHYISGILVTGKPSVRSYNNSPTFQPAISTAHVSSNFPFEICQPDPDGDSLSFQIIPSKSNANTNISYATGYSAAAPLGIGNSVSIDTANRLIIVNSSIQQNAIVNVKIVEWAKDTSGTYKIMGVLEREILFNTVPSPATSPANINVASAMASYGTNEIFITTANPVFPTSVNFDTVQVTLFDGNGTPNVVLGSMALASNYQAFVLKTADTIIPGPHTLIFNENLNNSMAIVGNCSAKLIDTISFFVIPPPPVLVGPTDSIYAIQNAVYNLTNFQYLDSASYSISNGTVVYSAPDYSQFEIEWGPVNGNASFSVYSFTNGESDTANISVTIHGIGIEEQNTAVKIYPNPVSDFIIINTQAKNIPDEYTITDVIGQTISHGSIVDGRISTKHLSSGSYILTLLENSTSAVHHFNIQVRQ